VVTPRRQSAVETAESVPARRPRRAGTGCRLGMGWRSK